MVTFFSFLFSFFFFLPSARKQEKKIGLRPLHSRKKFFDVPRQGLLILFFLSLFWEIILFHFVPPLPSRAPQVGVRGENGIFTWEREALGRKKSERETEERERERERAGEEEKGLSLCLLLFHLSVGKMLIPTVSVCNKYRRKITDCAQIERTTYVL